MIIVSKKESYLSDDDVSAIDYCCNRHVGQEHPNVDISNSSYDECAYEGISYAIENGMSGGADDSIERISRLYSSRFDSLVYTVYYTSACGFILRYLSNQMVDVTINWRATYCMSDTVFKLDRRPYDFDHFNEFWRRNYSCNRGGPLGFPY